MAKSNAGRKAFDGKDEKEVLSKLEEAFTWGCTDVEACLYADISPRTLYRYTKENERFGSRKEELKKSTTMLAKRNIHRDLVSADVNTSKWHLEHKNSDEYSKQIKQEHTGDVNLGVVMLPPKETTVENLITLPEKTNERLDTVSETEAGARED
tara:strand:- start:2448 stop:2909 length:462 start_codon:yes stop_codon:yes gene_type:complete